MKGVIANQTQATSFAVVGCMWWSQSLCGGLEQFSVSPRPLGSLLGLGWGWAYGVWGLKVLGQGLTIFFQALVPKPQRPVLSKSQKVQKLNYLVPSGLGLTQKGSRHF